ncbi:MAG: hypothetical protein ACUZ8H_15080 [Candidatus Anammoxibacter sp.]
MVLSKNHYYHRRQFCGAFGVATDLAAAANGAGMEDRAHNRDPYSQLDLV